MCCFTPLRGENKISSHTHKTGSWYLLGFFSKLPMSTPVLYMGVPHPTPPRDKFPPTNCNILVT